MPASYTIRRSVPRNTRRSKPASTPSTCFPSFSINLFMAFPLPRGDLSSNTTNIIREQETPSPFGCGYAALWTVGAKTDVKLIKSPGATCDSEPVCASRCSRRQIRHDSSVGERCQGQSDGVEENNRGFACWAKVQTANVDLIRRVVD